jgi:hypothetical protein
MGTLGEIGSAAVWAFVLYVILLSSLRGVGILEGLLDLL